MKNRADALRRRIGAHRCYLAVSADIRIFRLIRADIAAAEAELARLEARWHEADDAPQPRPVDPDHRAPRNRFT